jgi:hypothetical protein
MASTTPVFTLQPQRIKDIVLSGSGHAFDTRTGRSYTVNATGQVALLMLQDGKSAADIVDALVALCGQPTAVVEAGIDAFTRQMARVAA